MKKKFEVFLLECRKAFSLQTEYAVLLKYDDISIAIRSFGKDKEEAIAWCKKESTLHDAPAYQRLIVDNGIATKYPSV